MLSEERAYELANQSTGGQGPGVESGATELEQGWFFYWKDDGVRRIGGSHGLVVNKKTGAIFELGSGFPIERDLHMYDRGLDAEKHDLVITAIADLDETLTFVQSVEPTVIEPSFEHGTVWRIPRSLTDGEIRTRLATLPALFPDVQLYSTFEAIEEARSSGCCTVELFPRRR